MGWTNRGLKRILDITFRQQNVPTNWYIMLFTVDDVPDADTNTVSDLTEIAAGNGYTTGGYQLTPGATDFDVLTEDDSNDLAFIQVKDVVFTASGGSIPDSGGGARYAALVDDNGTIADREVIFWWDLASDHTVGDGGTNTLRNLEARLTQPS